jgi:hypothetical protein
MTRTTAIRLGLAARTLGIVGGLLVVIGGSAQGWICLRRCHSRGDDGRERPQPPITKRSSTHAAIRARVQMTNGWGVTSDDAFHAGHDRSDRGVGSGGQRNTSSSACDGVLKPRVVCRGRSLSSRAMASKSAWVRVRKSGAGAGTDATGQWCSRCSRAARATWGHRSRPAPRWRW